MLNRYFALALSGGLLASGAVWAQVSPKVLGAAMDVQGLVTVSDGSTVASVANRSPIVDGARFVTSSSGSVTLKFDQGCEIKLQPNQSLVVRDSRPCPALIASIQSIPGEAAGAVPLRNSVALLALGLGALAGAGSGGGDGGSGGSGGVIPPGGGGGVIPPGGGGGVIPELPISGQ